jgi:hypothetical protein
VIGRVKASAPACSILRDLTLPALRIAQRANRQFNEELAPALIENTDAKLDPYAEHVHAMTAAKVSQLVSRAMDDATQISKALGDPRLAKDSPDPDVQAQRVQLTQLYEYQWTRAVNLWKGQTQESTAADIADLQTPKNDSTYAGNVGPMVAHAPASASSVHVQATPGPGPTDDPLDGSPQLSGNADLDMKLYRRWVAKLEVGARDQENAASHAAMAVLDKCS